MADTVLAIFGPTASGKTAVAQALAQRIPAELVSADSMQVYRGLPILTNQAPGRLVGIWPLDHEASVGEYQELAQAAIDEILAAGRTPVVVGGTGLYLRAALADLRCRRRPRPANASAGSASTTTKGREQAHDAPRRARSAKPPPRCTRTIVGASCAPRAGEGSDAGRATGSGASETRHPTLVFGLDVPKEELERRIDERTGAMFAAGVRGEVEARTRGRRSPRPRAYALGLADVAEHPDDEDAIEALAARTRRYAAYQRKWMRRIPGLVSLPADRPPGEIADAILEVARARQRLPAGRAG